jgi:PAS domain S-box-containing protein
MKVRIKLILLLIFCMISFVSLIAVHVNVMEGKLEAVFYQEEKTWLASIDKQLSLVGESLKECVYDYAYWDEMVKFLSSGDKLWAQGSVNASLQTYKAEAAWIFKKDLSLYYVANVSGDGFFDKSPIPEGAITELFAVERFCHFFINTPKGIMEIRGATIHTSPGDDKKAEPHGYFFAGRLWDETYLSDISILTDTHVTVSQITVSGSPEYVSDPKNGLIASTRILSNWNGVPIARLNILKFSATISDLIKLSGQMIFILVAYSVVLFTVLWFCLAYWISNPLWIISRAFTDKRPVSEEGLLRQKDEFGEMAAMMNRFFAQRERLVTEISEHKRSVHALRISEEKYRDLYNSILDGIVRVSMEGRIEECNSAYRDMLGYAEEELKRMTYIQLTPEKWHELEAGIIAGQVIAKGHAAHYEKEYIRKDGTIFPIEVSTWLIRDENKNPVGMWGIVRDMTDRKKAAEELAVAHGQLVQSEKMAALGRFASGVAHEVKNPLAILLGGLEYLNERLTDMDKDVQEAFSRMKEAVLRANTIVKDLLAFARPSKMVYEKVHPNVVVSDAIGFIDLLRHKSSKAAIEIKRELTQEDMLVEVDRNQIQQALFNILLNAIEAIPTSGSVTVRTRLDAAGSPPGSGASRPACLIEVRDTGGGIDKEDLAKLFEPFFTTKRGQKGTGLGLAIVKSIVEKHGGRISIDSEVGLGTTVRIILPIVK